MIEKTSNAFEYNRRLLLWNEKEKVTNMEKKERNDVTDPTDHFNIYIFTTSSLRIK